MSTAPMAATCAGRDLALELLDPGSVPLYRLFRHPGGDWEETPEIHRHERVDPPDGHKGDFAVLYMGDSLPVVAMECRILRADFRDHFTWSTSAAGEYQVVRYMFSEPAIFLPIDGPNRSRLGLAGAQRKLGSKEPFRDAALALYNRYKGVVHGLSWESMHRDQPGRVYALWHRHKATIGLARLASVGKLTVFDYPKLTDDVDWKAFLRDSPEIEAVNAFTGAP